MLRPCKARCEAQYFWQTLSPGFLQNDPANAGLLHQRRTLSSSDDDSNDEDDDDDEDGDIEDNHTEENGEEIEEGEGDRQRGAEEDSAAAAAAAGLGSKVSGRSRGAAPADAEENPDDEEDEEDEPELGRHHKHHHKKHHKKKHKKDRQQCRYLEGLSRSVVKFGTSSGDYLAVSHGNNTCYQAVSGLSCFSHISAMCSPLSKAMMACTCNIFLVWHPSLHLPEDLLLGMRIILTSWHQVIWWLCIAGLSTISDGCPGGRVCVWSTA